MREISHQIIEAMPIRLVNEFRTIPNTAFIRESQLVQCPNRPANSAILPFSAATLWRKVAAGTFPKPIKLSKRVTAWRVGDVRSYLQAPEWEVA